MNLLKLSQVKLRRYRSINETGPFDVEPDVTTLVGKNESGKTAVLQALSKSFSVDGTEFNPGIDYPTALTRERNRATSPIPVTILTYTLDDEDVVVVERELGAGSISSREFTITKHYDGSEIWNIPLDEIKVVNHLRSNIELPPSDQATVNTASTVRELIEMLSNLKEANSGASRVIDTVSEWKDHQPQFRAISILSMRRPKFVYFADYDIMPGEVNINELIAKKNSGELSRGQRAFVSLLSVAGLKPDDLTDLESSEQLIREIENASNSITDDVFKYWTQNQNLRVQLKMGQSMNTGPTVQIRVLNEKHHVTVPFDERSRGFVWFFSFLAYFSEIEEDSNNSLILLLDEPGLSLHAKAQADLLHFIDERLAHKHQVIFTTHSPFMVDANHFERIRTVEDRESSGTVVSSDVLKAEKDTVFPLLTSMGIGLTQTLWVGPNVLLVEGPSDVIFLNYLSDALRSSGRICLDERWTVTPGGGIAKLPYFFALFDANKMNVTVLTDSSRRDEKILTKLRKTGRLSNNSSLIQIGEVLRKDEADLEDLFTDSFYLTLVNEAYAGALGGKSINVSELSSKDRLTSRVEAYFIEHNINGRRFNHFAPANVLMKRLVEPPDLDDSTLNYAEELFKKINEHIVS